MTPWRRVSEDDSVDDSVSAGEAKPFSAFPPVSGDQPVPSEQPLSAEQPVSGEPPVSGEQPVSGELPWERAGLTPVTDPSLPLAQQVYSGEFRTSGVAVTSGEQLLAPQPTHSTENLIDRSESITERRGGRNMVAATVVGLSLLALVMASAWYHPLALAGVLYAFCVGAIIEWRRALLHHGSKVPLEPMLAATAGMAVATWFALAEGLAVALLVGCAGLVAWRVVDERIENTLVDSLTSMFTLMWIPFLASFVMLMEYADQGWERVLILIVAVVGNDSGGLYSGMLFGRHKMAPRISPKKTWEGAVGGLVLGTAVATTAAYYLLEQRWWIGATVGLFCAAAAALGDLAESAIKRDMRVKDMSHALPGHGGIMDRLDSVLVAAPVAYLIFAIFLGTT